MKNNYYIIIIFCIFIFSDVSADIERRAAIDIGSGGTKLAIADVDTETNRIIEVIFDSSFSVPYQQSLDLSEDNRFDEITRALGLETFQEIKELAAHYEVKQIAAIATSAFRKAQNSGAFVSEVYEETGIKIRVIPQREEGEIAYFSALAAGALKSEHAVVWDIGTGSLQMTTRDLRGDLTVYMGEEMGSVAFKNYIVKEVQAHDLESKSSPNPMNEDDLYEADRYARDFARKANQTIKQRILKSGKVIGIGRLFYHSIRPLASENGVITRKALRKYIANALNKTDDELHSPYAHVDVTNCILTLAMMKALHIQQVEAVETTTTRGLLISPKYW